MKSAQVVLYVVPGCPLCADARAWLKANGIDYVERDVANEYAALRRMYKLTRQGLVPVFERNNQAVVRPDEAALRAFVDDTNV